MCNRIFQASGGKTDDRINYVGKTGEQYGKNVQTSHRIRHKSHVMSAMCDKVNVIRQTSFIQ